MEPDKKRLLELLTEPLKIKDSYILFYSYHIDWHVFMFIEAFIRMILDANLYHVLVVTLYLITSMWNVKPALSVSSGDQLRNNFQRFLLIMSSPTPQVAKKSSHFYKTQSFNWLETENIQKIPWRSFVLCWILFPVADWRWHVYRQAIIWYNLKKDFY